MGADGVGVASRAADTDTHRMQLGSDRQRDKHGTYRHRAYAGIGINACVVNRCRYRHGDRKGALPLTCKRRACCGTTQKLGGYSRLAEPILLSTMQMACRKQCKFRH